MNPISQTGLHFEPKAEDTHSKTQNHPKTESEIEGDVKTNVSRPSELTFKTEYHLLRSVASTEHCIALSSHAPGERKGKDTKRELEKKT